MTIPDRLAAAVQSGRLLSSAADNVRSFLQAGLPAWARDSIAELVDAEAR